MPEFDAKLQELKDSAGRWKLEPDVRLFEAEGLHCELRRGPLGQWCGYVSVPEGHPLHGKQYNDTVVPPEKLIERDLDIAKVGILNVFCAGRHEQPIEEKCDIVLLLDVHGGLTYSGERDGKWWFGFDCAHNNDLCPGMLKHSLSLPWGTYRTIEYAEQECRNLAKQLKEWPNAN